jgi:putative transposase
VAFHLIAISLRQILRLLLFRCRSSRAKDVELLVLRQELDVLRRQVPRPRFRPEERLVLSVLQFLRPARDRLSSLVTPDTIRRWHREMVRKKWHYRHRVVSRGRIPEHVQILVWRLASEKSHMGVLSHPRRAQEGRGRDLDHQHPAHPGRHPTAAAAQRDLAPVHANSGRLNYRL